MMKMSLWKYSGQFVKLIDIDNRNHIGIVEFYTSEYDDPDGIASISLRPYDTEGILIDFTESEIINIELVSSNSTKITKMAEAV